jgi:single-strand DNA-binding protein
MPAEPYAYNSVQCVGNLGADPELRFTSTGGKICEMRIAIYAGKDRTTGEARSAWITVKCFGHAAEWAGDNLLKGDRVAITEGQIDEESWQDRETGKRRSKLIVKAWKMAKVVRSSPVAAVSTERPQDQPDQPSQPTYEDIPF